MLVALCQSVFVGSNVEWLHQRLLLGWIGAALSRHGLAHCKGGDTSYLWLHRKGSFSEDSGAIWLLALILVHVFFARGKLVQNMRPI